MTRLYNTSSAQNLKILKLISTNWKKEIIHILEEYENHGYPFVQIKLDSIFIENDSLSGIMKIKKGKYFTIDSIHITGSAKIPEKYLYTVIEFKPGDQYQEYKLKTLDEKLKSIAFIEVTQPSEVIFGQDYCYIKIYADNRKINRISGILGLFPDNRSGKTLITGDVSLQLNNALHKAEKIAFQWKRIQVQTQQLSIQFDYPFVFNSIFGIDEDFRLFKRDTSFLDLQNKTGIQLIPDARQKLRLWIKQRNISNLGNSSINYSLANVNQNSVGLGYIFNSTTGKIIPSKGIVANADFFCRTKKPSTTVFGKIILKVKVTNLNFPEHSQLINPSRKGKLSRSQYPDTHYNIRSYFFLNRNVLAA